MDARSLTDTGHTPRGVDEAQSSEDAPLRRVDLANVMLKGVRPDLNLVHSWLYEGGLHTIQSEPGVGKSWLALWIATHLISAGIAVVYLDEDGGEEIVAERLLALGADPALVGALFWYYPFTERLWGTKDVEQLARVLRLADAAAQPQGIGLVVLDSLPDFLAYAGLNENSAQDVTAFVHRLLAPVRANGAALLVLDHLAKLDPGNRLAHRRSRYARGSGAKLAKGAISLLVETETPFDREHSGSLRVWKTKDRRGAIHIPDLGSKPLVLDVVVADDGGSVRITERSEEGAPAGEPEPRREELLEAISRVLEGSQTPLSQHQVEKTVKGRSPDIRQALRQLIGDGYVLRTVSSGAHLHSVLAPYRAPT